MFFVAFLLSATCVLGELGPDTRTDCELTTAAAAAAAAAAVTAVAAACHRLPRHRRRRRRYLRSEIRALTPFIVPPRRPVDRGGAERLPRLRRAGRVPAELLRVAQVRQPPTTTRHHRCYHRFGCRDATAAERAHTPPLPPPAPFDERPTPAAHASPADFSLHPSPSPPAKSTTRRSTPRRARWGRGGSLQVCS